MAWLKTIDGDFVNLDSGVGIIRTDLGNEVYISAPAIHDLPACCGTPEQTLNYMKSLEHSLLKSGEIIIDPS